jgi:hypothetical protein
MNLNAVRISAGKHIQEVRAHLSHIMDLEPTDPLEPMPFEVKVLNGLFYVNLYSALERSVNDTVQRTLTYIASISVRNSHLSGSFCTISLFSTLSSLKDSKNSKFIIKSTELFARQVDDNIATINESCLAIYLQNVRINTVDELFDAFGINKLNLNPTTRLSVDEIVENRNKVAHGREQASIVGERHRANSLRQKTDEVSELINSIIDSFEEFCISKSFIKPAERYRYPDPSS